MWGYREFFPRSTPRAAKGGIKAQTKRGQFGATWWAKRWIEVLESFDIGARLSRGRSYARRGQVLSIDISKGKVKAKVQGSRPKPYDIVIEVKVLSDKEWDKLVRVLSGQALYAAKLLAGEMPQDIEKVFQDAGLTLFPQKRVDLKTECSCPDWSNPCKHIAAVYYLLGEEFDRDPFLIFQLRGLGREELFVRLNEMTPAAKPARAAGKTVETEEAAPLPEEPLPVDPKAFWSMGNVSGDLFGDVQVPPKSAAWPRRLGNFPFWRGEEHFLDALASIYREAAQRGMDVFLGERESKTPRSEPEA
jgi:uncharacterized Zn finger protein